MRIPLKNRAPARGATKRAPHGKWGGKSSERRGTRKDDFATKKIGIRGTDSHAIWMKKSIFMATSNNDKKIGWSKGGRRGRRDKGRALTKTGLKSELGEKKTVRSW